MGDVTDILGVKAVEKDLEFVVDTDSRVPVQLVGDPMRLQQVLLNLAGNAIKFTEEGEIVVKTELISQNKSDVQLKFSVIDSGIGLTPSQIKRLFRPFSQADGSITRNYGGTGLGLAICKKLAELMGGHIGVVSEPGLGSTFFFTVVARARPLERSDHYPTSDHLKGKHVLVVDGHPTTRRVLGEMLTSFSLTVSEAPDLKSAEGMIGSARVSSGKSL